MTLRAKFSCFTLRQTCIVLLGLVLSGCGGSGSQEIKVNSEPVPAQPPSPTITRQQVVSVAAAKHGAFASANNPEDGYPRSVDAISGAWSTRVNDWTNGFYPGLLWYLFDATGQENLVTEAERWTLPLASNAIRSTHDVGFIINDSFGKGFRRTNQSQYADPLSSAAVNLSSRFSSNIGAVRSWENPSGFVVIIDSMMNLPLMFEAAKLFTDDLYFQQAVSHAEVVARELVRPNGSSYHVVNFDEDTGLVQRKHTHQGLSDSSTWARGQAWGIYGFAYAARESGRQDFLSTSQALADFFLSQLPQDGVPKWDFDAPASAPKDTSASVIAASGLWLLAGQLQGQAATDYRKASTRLIDSLLNDTYIDLENASPSILLQGVGAKPDEEEVGVGLIYGDYYLIEAILMQEGILAKPS